MKTLNPASVGFFFVFIALKNKLFFSIFAPMQTHQHFMQRCIDIARNGLSLVMPNPSVGAVVVVGGQIVAEGVTSAYGGAHAEVNAINAVKDLSVLERATLYVSLEPCSHFGKTPPCADLVIKHKIPRVVVGCLDPNPKVAGAGIQRMEASGIEVVINILEKECRESNKRFFCFHEKKRPYIILKWAQSCDGFIAPRIRNEQKPVFLTNQYSQQLVHKWRSQEMAILVGTKTVLDDNPTLTTRHYNGKNPVRIVLDADSKILQTAAVFDNQANTIALNKRNLDFSGNVATQICKILLDNNLQSVIIEGGTKTIQTFIDENLWDEARVFSAKIQLFEGTKAPIFGVKFRDKISILNDDLFFYENL